jgi:hypothetical protein
MKVLFGDFGSRHEQRRQLVYRVLGTRDDSGKQQSRENAFKEWRS